MGQFFLGENQSRIYPNMCAKLGCGPTVVSKKGGYRHRPYRQTDTQTDKGTLQLYIVDDDIKTLLPEWRKEHVLPVLAIDKLAVEINGEVTVSPG